MNESALKPWSDHPDSSRPWSSHSRSYILSPFLFYCIKVDYIKALLEPGVFYLRTLDQRFHLLFAHFSQMVSRMCFLCIALAAESGSLLKTATPIKWEVIKVVLHSTAINRLWHFEYTASTQLLVNELLFVFISSSGLLTKRNITAVECIAGF